MNPTLALFFGPPGWGELLVLGMLGLLIFGKRLPEIGKSVGRGIVEFKKGLSGLEDDVKNAGQIPGSSDPDQLPTSIDDTQEQSPKPVHHATSPRKNP